MPEEGAVEVLAFGEALVALIAHPPGPLIEATSFTPHVVGAESNVAIGCARLGRRVAFVGRVGEDDLGAMITRRLSGEGVDITHVTVDSAPTGLLLRNLRGVPPPSVLYRRSGSAGSQLCAADVAAALNRAPAGAVCHVSAITPALSPSAREAFELLVQGVEAHACRLSLDLNYRLRLWTGEALKAALRPAVPASWLVTGTEAEAELITGVAGPGSARALVDLGAEIAVVRHGTAGATVHDRSSGSSLEVSGTVLDGIVDPVGAGDAFAAGLISSLIGGLPLAEAVALAHRCGAAVSGAVGDIEAALCAPELTRWNGMEIHR